MQMSRGLDLFTATQSLTSVTYQAIHRLVVSETAPGQHERVDSLGPKRYFNSLYHCQPNLWSILAPLLTLGECCTPLAINREMRRLEKRRCGSHVKRIPGAILQVSKGVGSLNLLHWRFESLHVTVCMPKNCRGPLDQARSYSRFAVSLQPCSLGIPMEVLEVDDLPLPELVIESWNDKLGPAQPGSSRTTQLYYH